MKKDERGSLVVEATLSFVVFVLVLATLISLINVMWVYMRIQHAMVSTVSELSGYTYIYSAVGLQKKHDGFMETAKETGEKVDKLFENLSALSKASDELGNGGLDLSGIQDAGEIVIDTGEQLEGMISNPVATLKGFLALALKDSADFMKTELLDAVAKPLMNKYLEYDTTNVGGNIKTADELLRGNGVVGGLNGLDFSKSKLFSNTESDYARAYTLIDLVVTYELQIPLSPIPLKANMMQRAVTSAWLDGDGEHYEKK